MAGGFDHALAAQAFNSDLRQWVSYGVVSPDSPEAPAVRFNDEEGAPLPTGPLVTVTLQPSGIEIPCRVGSFIAGLGEGTWYPFLEGDEVLVVLPQGHEQGGAVIVDRMNQEIDKWPAIVAGQDATKNKFGFWRLRSPFIIESAESFLIRSAKTGAQIGIDGTGQVVMSQGDRHHLFVGSDVISLSDGDDTVFLQLHVNDQVAMLQAGPSRFELSADGETVLHAAGQLVLGAGARGGGHAVTAEQVVAFAINLIAQLVATSALSPAFVAAYNASPTAAIAAVAGIVGPALAALGTPTPFAGLAAGNFAPFVGTIFGPAGPLKAAMSNPLAFSDPTGTTIGFGRGSILL